MKKVWKKRLIAMATVLLIAPVVLSGCKGGSKTESAPKDSDGNIIMKIGQQTQPNSKLPEGDTYDNNAYRRLIKEKLGIDIQSSFEATGDDYTRQVSLAIASGDIPDMMAVSRDELEELVDNDLVADLSDVYEKYASDNIKSIYDSFDDMQLDAATFDGKLMAIPGTANDFGPNMVWIRQDWLDKLSIKLDQDGNNAITLDELQSTAKAFKENDPDNTGKAVGAAFLPYLTSGDHGGSGFTATAIANAFGAFPKQYLEDSDGKLYYGSNTEEMKDTLSYLKSWYDQGLLDPQFGTRTFDDITAMMVNGELGIVPGPWHLSDWSLVQAKTANPNALFTPFALENENGDGKVNGISKPSTGSFIVIRKGFENPEALIKIINLIFDEVPNSKDMATEFPEIYSYAQSAVDGSVRPVNIELFKNLSEIDDAVQASQAAEGKTSIDDITNFTVKNNALKIKAYLDDPTGSDPTDWAVYASRLLAVNNVMNGVREAGIFNEIKPPVILDKIDATERNGAQIAKLEEETFIKFITGEESIDKFDQYAKTWNKQGGTAIIEEMQKALEKQED